MNRAEAPDESGRGRERATPESRTMAAAIASAVKSRREELGLTLQEVAERAGIGKTHLWEIEQGRSRNPTLLTALALCRALAMPLNRLVGQDVSQPVMSEQELELVAAHRRIFGGALRSTDPDGDEREVG